MKQLKFSWSGTVWSARIPGMVPELGPRTLSCAGCNPFRSVEERLGEVPSGSIRGPATYQLTGNYFNFSSTTAAFWCAWTNVSVRTRECKQHESVYTRLTNLHNSTRQSLRLQIQERKTIRKSLGKRPANG